MLALVRIVLLAHTLFSLCASLHAQEKAAPRKDPVAAMQRFLEAMDVETGPFQAKQPLSQALERLRESRPKIEFAIRIDKEAGFDERFLKTPVQLAKEPKRLPALVLLDNLLGQVRKALNVDLDAGVSADGIVLTSSKRAALDKAYDVRELVPDAARLSENMKPLLKRPLDKGGPESRLLQLVAAITESRAFESLQIVNGKEMLVHATPVKQREVRELIESLRRLADLAVVMDAQLFEVDRTFFVQHVLPVLVDEKTKLERPIVPLGAGPLLEKLTKLKPIAKSVDDKLRGGRPGLVLSVRQAIKRAKRAPERDPEPARKDKDEEETSVVGVVIEAVADVTPDRRFVRLDIRQKIDEVGEPVRIRFGDPDIGFEDVEQPTLRSLKVSSGIGIPDGGTILLRVPYHPPHDPSRVWLLVAQPRIFIQAEEDAIRAGK